MKTKIIIIGMGNMGKRHLQAISGLARSFNYYCYDIDQGALDSLAAFCRMNRIAINGPRLINNYEGVLKEVDGDSIVVVASTAKDRARMLEAIIKLKPLAIIAEKPLCQTLAEYNKVMALAKSLGIPIYINFSRHMYDFYQSLYGQLKGGTNASILATFPNGMACIGIHLFELAVWLTRANSYEILSSDYFGLFETKRKGYQDFYGKLAVKMGAGNLCVFNAVPQANPVSIMISSPTGEAVIYEEINKLVSLDTQGSLSVKDIKILFTSQITGTIVNDIIASGTTTKLPDIFQSYLAHQMLFDYMKQHALEKINVT